MFKITIVTIVYNAEIVIEQVISSVVGQSYKNKEYIIIDGGSTDKTLEIIRKYNDNISYWVSEPDRGIYDAMNKGIEVATGDYILFLGADDAFVSDNALEKAVNNILQLQDQGKKVDIASFPVILVNGDLSLEKKVSGIKGDECCPKMIPHQGMFSSRILLKKYKFDIKYKIAADYKFFLECYYDKDVSIEILDDPAISYFSVEGVSSVYDFTWEEKRDIQLEMGIPQNWVRIEKYNHLGILNYIKKILYKLNLLSVVLIFFKGWKKHRCNNRICRWCGRMERN
jgi:glycosyltransferase family 2 protein